MWSMGIPLLSNTVALEWRAVGTTLQSYTISWNEKAFLLIFFVYTDIIRIFATYF